MAKLYKYTIYKQDGTIEELEPCPGKDFKALYKMLNCEIIELIPDLYYKSKNWGKVTVYGDEEGRFNSENIRNPHFDVLIDADGSEWDVVGNLIKEEVWKPGK